MPSIGPVTAMIYEAQLRQSLSSAPDSRLREIAAEFDNLSPFKRFILHLVPSRRLVNRDVAKGILSERERAHNDGEASRLNS